MAAFRIPPTRKSRRRRLLAASGAARGRLRQPGRAIARRERKRKRAFETRGRQGLSFFPSSFPPTLPPFPPFPPYFHLKKRKEKRIPVLGSCKILENGKEGCILQASVEDPESLKEKARSLEEDGEGDFKYLAFSQRAEGWGGEFPRLKIKPYTVCKHKAQSKQDGKRCYLYILIFETTLSLSGLFPS